MENQVKLINAEINILGLERYHNGKYSKLAILYEFPYRKNGERRWCKQIYFDVEPMISSDDDICGDIYSRVQILRKFLER